MNPNNLFSMTRSHMTQGLAPGASLLVSSTHVAYLRLTRGVVTCARAGIERVEAPVEVFGRWPYAPVMAEPAPAERRYVMHGEFQRTFSYYIVLTKPQRIKELLVTFGSCTSAGNRVRV